ncbi:uncharacterized protein V1516DRAFT_670706 [Lipomyces oligophaga]|uniref:uncharacterized protein n=1 Tax=Lipomyces oligophaga TaxID=45792 RepID=UPI0034CF0B08
MTYDTKESALHFLNAYPRHRWLWKLGSMTIMSLTGVLSRGFLYGFHNVKTTGLNEFLETLDRSRLDKRTMLTVSNHISVIDDPLIWGLMPLNRMFDPKKLRWSLGAANICFGTKFTSWFFSMGQVLATYRFGAGPYQGSVDSAIHLLSSPSPSKPFQFPDRPLVSQWVHIFPESLVHQAYPPHKTTMKYFHWGVSRLILESASIPVIVPIFHNGLQDVFPEDREKWKYLPRTVIFPKLSKSKRLNLSFAFGNPLPDDYFATERAEWSNIPLDQYDGDAARKLRSKVAAKLRKAVISARSLLDLPEEDPRLKDPAFWAAVDESSGIKTAGKYAINPVKVIEKEG